MEQRHPLGLKAWPTADVADHDRRVEIVAEGLYQITVADLADLIGRHCGPAADRRTKALNDLLYDVAPNLLDADSKAIQTEH